MSDAFLSYLAELNPGDRDFWDKCRHLSQKYFEWTGQLYKVQFTTFIAASVILARNEGRAPGLDDLRRVMSLEFIRNQADFVQSGLFYRISNEYNAGSAVDVLDLSDDSIAVLSRKFEEFVYMCSSPILPSASC